MYFNQAKGNPKISTSQRSLTPTMIIESPKVALANYKQMIKKSKEKPKAFQNPNFSSGRGLQGYPSVIDTIASTDTCIFTSPMKSDTTTIEDLREQLTEMHKFTKTALESQKNYFEEIIAGLQQEMEVDKEFFNSELSLIREELLATKAEKDDLSTILPDKSSSWDIQAQYIKNQEFISILERQNRLLYEKLTRVPDL